jgi:NADH dehydrogenase
MILVAGGTGRLGTQVVSLLRERGLRVRVLTRDRSRGSRLGAGVEVVEGDVTVPAGLVRSVEGVRTVVSAIQGFAGPRGTSPATVDRDGNRNLIQAAQVAGVEHLVLVSVRDAGPDHPMDLMRMKHAAEQTLQCSGLAWTIIRPTAYMETWCEVLGRPLLEHGRSVVLGRGRNPINWVSVVDVARVVELAILDPALHGRTIEVSGPENLTMTEFVRVLRNETGSAGRVGHVPLTAMRVGARMARLINPAMARQIQAGIIMDTRPQTFEEPAAGPEHAPAPLTSLAEVVRRDFAVTPRQGPAG